MIPVNMKMFAMTTEQGTAASETALCEICIKSNSAVQIARDAARQSTDLQPDQEFADCTGNESLSCCACGKST